MFFSRWAELILATVGGYILFYLAFKQIPLVAGFRRLPDVSYGVYLYGWPVQKLFLWYFPKMSPWILFPLSLVVFLIMGAHSWYIVEKQFLKFKKKQNFQVAVN
jgi:peptidoglycan/LPS O-acetylase OafA/YrhL